MKTQKAMALLALVTLGACASAELPAQTPAPTPTPAAASADTSRKGYTAADVKFMQGMIGHHRQALAMSELVPARTSRRDFALMAERITLSQESEIAQMERWLQQRGETVPAADAHVHAAMGHGELMPGMLTEAELTQLANARGVEFEKLFLQLMIKHHEGALHMVKQLYASPGAGQEPELFILASDVDADQTAEIRRMRTLLGQL
ncbi:MAG TPA: DUF305 domain-containing protein [Longimicrobiales bacterium]